MCKYCKEGIYCYDCGVLVCLDVKRGDDVIRPAIIFEDGFLCDYCWGSYFDFDDFDD